MTISSSGGIKKGDRVQIIGSFSPRRQYLSKATGEVQQVMKSKASVLLDPPENKAYKPHTVKIDLCSLNLICVVEQVQDFVLLVCNSNLDSSALLTMTTTATKSSSCVTQKSQTTATCECCLSVISEGSGDKLISSQLRHRVSRSVCKESAGERKTSVIASPPSNEPSNQLGQDSSLLRTCQDSLAAVETPTVKHSIFSTSYAKLPSSATMQNGFVSAQDTLPAPILETGYCWLESPGALSSTGNGRPPGQSRLEAQLRQHGLLTKDEVLTPDFLLNGYSLPPSYLDPSESKAATELLEDSERQPEIFLTPELPPSPSAESFTLIACPSCKQELLNLEDGCGVCGWFPPELKKPRRRKASGWIECYLKNKKLKSGDIATYPRVLGERDKQDPMTADPHHYYWAYKYEQKSPKARSNNGFISKAVGLHPSHVEAVRRAIAIGRSVSEILILIEHLKDGKDD